MLRLVSLRSALAGPVPVYLLLRLWTRQSGPGCKSDVCEPATQELSTSPPRRAVILPWPKHWRLHLPGELAGRLRQ